MTKLISVLMPTVNPLKGLIKALHSIELTCCDPSMVEVLLRIDLDNLKRIEEASKLANEFDFQITCVVGPRGNGYLNMGEFIDDLVKVAQGKWCWLFDDDAWVEGNTWQQQVASVPCDPEHGPALNAQLYKLGPSTYQNSWNGGPVGLIVPTDFARQIKHRNPVDQQWLDVLLEKGWKIKLLEGITYCHDGRPR